MDVLYEIVKALWHQDFAALANPKVIWLVYGVMFLTLLLENGLLPAAFLPGDSLLLLAGAMVAKGVMNFIPTMIILTVAASLGCWLGYLQGRWLGNTRLVKSWLFHLPEQYHQRAWHLFTRHGLVALLLGRFLAFCAYHSAYACRDFRPEKWSFSAVQLAKRIAVGGDSGEPGLCH
ncbi:DedA family protein [Erwinia pyrifoliae]|uniref:DedA family protein n=1 Tax=Erwinia pyrifoliae TaxID=79967 RepID=UPI0034D97762